MSNMDGLNLENTLNLFNMLLSMIEFVITIYFFCMFVLISHLIKPPYQTLHKKKHPIESGKERTMTEDQPPTKRQQPNAQIRAIKECKGHLPNVDKKSNLCLKPFHLSHETN